MVLYPKTLEYSQVILLNRDFCLLFFNMLSSSEANLFYELVVSSHTLSDTCFINQVLELKLKGFRSPSVLHRDYESSPFFRNYRNFDEYVKKVCNAVFGNLGASSTTVKLFFKWWNKIYGKNSRPAQEQAKRERGD